MERFVDRGEERWCVTSHFCVYINPWFCLILLKTNLPSLNSTICSRSSVRGESFSSPGYAVTLAQKLQAGDDWFTVYSTRNRRGKFPRKLTNMEEWIFFPQSIQTILENKTSEIMHHLTMPASCWVFRSVLGNSIYLYTYIYISTYIFGRLWPSYRNFDALCAFLQLFWPRGSP